MGSCRCCTLTTAQRPKSRKGRNFSTHTPFEFYEANGLDAAMPYFQLADSKHPRPALVLLDYEMGGHTGLDFLYWLRGLKKITGLPVVMLSGSPGRDHVVECYAAGQVIFSGNRKIWNL